MSVKDAKGHAVPTSTQKAISQWLSILVVAATFVGASPTASAYKPTDPIVSKMVDRGLVFLEGVKDISGREGNEVLLAYAHHKCRHDPEAPIVKRGLAAAAKFTKSVEDGRADDVHKRNYLIPICVLLFADVDPQRYKPELQVLSRSLMEGQYANGAFGYPNEKDGDISQTQYALLAIWVLDRNGIPLDYNRVVAAAQWLMRVQDISGAWPYHGKDPGVGKPNIQQKKVYMSMALAGGSSVLIAGDALRLWGDTIDDSDPGIPGLPEAIKIFKEDENVKRRKRAAMSQEPIKRSVKLMDAWRQKNPYKRTSRIDWYYYQLYTLERFESFVEIANGSPKDSSPSWYNKGVDELRQFQGAEGGWEDRAHTHPAESTAFALLFLIRSTQKAIFTDHSGALRGGYGLPKDTTDIRVDGTQIKGRPIAAQVTDLLDLLEEDGADDMEGKSIPDDLQLEADPAKRKAQLDRLERMVRGSKSWQARRVAAKLLGKSDELRVVPSLIYALSDGDDSVRMYARDGLRFISRKFEGFGMSKTPSRPEREKAQLEWRDWYRRMNPKYVFLDYDL
ncbi:MAG: hypothetical protein AB8B91_24550 [Rubripirellula sp.]